MLTENAAWALLKRYCEPLREAKWVHSDFQRYRGLADAALEVVDLVLRSPQSETTTQARMHGARARLALGVAQAVRYCRGFDPVTHPSFWRRVVPKLWPGFELQPPDRLALSRATFAHVALRWESSSHADVAFWTGLFNGTSACDAALVAVLNRLESHWEIAGPLPPVRVSLSRTHSYETTDPGQSLWLPLPCAVALDPIVEPLALWTILRAALAQPTEVWTATTTQIDLVVDSLTIGRLALQLAPPDPPRSAGQGFETVTRGRALGSILRTLLFTDGALHVHTMVLMGCSHADFRLVGAALSAAATASPPITAVRCSGLFYAARPEHKLQRLAWLAFTLYCHCRSTLPPQLSLTLLSSDAMLSEHECDYVTQLLARGTPLRGVVGETLRLRLDRGDDQVARLHVHCLRLGSTVRFRRGTRLFFEPFRVNTGAEAVAAEVDGEELDLVAHVIDRGGFVAVMYGGFGLVWATAASVATWQCLSDDGDVPMAESDASPLASLAVALTSLTLRFEGTVENLPLAVMPSALRISAVLPLLARETLKALAIDRALVTTISPTLSAVAHGSRHSRLTAAWWRV